jgi:hypothetical protein
VPVSKKRKKDGKPVHRAPAAAEPVADEHAAPEAKATPVQTRVMGRPTNPFVASMPKGRAAQRGR